MIEPKVIVALDFASERKALSFVDSVSPDLCRLKVGKELFTLAGPRFVEGLVVKGFDVFLDLKYHDIPNTVAASCRVAAGLGVWMVNVHAMGGRRMLEAARDAIPDKKGPLLVAVTILTSMDNQDLAGIGVTESPEFMVQRLAKLSAHCSLDGVVCSAQEAEILREQLGDAFRLVCPGIRPKDAEIGDQRRVVTPAEAIIAGASDLVIGRPITQAADPIGVLQHIKSEISDIHQ